MEAPIACSLSATDFAARKADTATLTRTALLSREPLANGVRFTFDPEDSVETDLRSLVAAEASCCPFLTLDLVAQCDELRLDVTGPADAQPIIAELFA